MLHEQRNWPNTQTCSLNKPIALQWTKMSLFNRVFTSAVVNETLEEPLKSSVPPQSQHSTELAAQSSKMSGKHFGTNKRKKITVWLNWLQKSPCDDSFFHLSVHCADSWRIYCRKERQSYLMSNCNVTIEFSELWHVQLLRCDYRDVLHSWVPKSIRGL